MKFLRYILFPFVPIYYVVTWTRNVCYDLGWKSSKSYSLPIICVGNLSVGGTGKSPLIEYLISLLKSNYKVATLSRGYKRETTGFKLADFNDTAKTLGDEPFQFYNKFGEDIQVAVDANRQHGIESLLRLKNSPEVILLDDAFQHRKVRAGLNILLTSYNNLYCHDFVLPTGNLREPKSGANRAQIIVVTKCPKGLSENDKNQIIKQLKSKPNQKVFFSVINYSKQVFSATTQKALTELSFFTLVTGIANPTPLIEHLKLEGLEFEHLNFKDHHRFSEKEIEALGQLDLVLTTEKDYMRLKDEASLKDKLFYLPIEVTLDNSEAFNSKILNFIGA